MQLRSFAALYAAALLSNHAAQGYRINSKKLMTSDKLTSQEGGVFGKNKPRNSVLHSFDSQGEQQSDLEHVAENADTPEAAGQALTSSYTSMSAPFALVGKQAANASESEDSQSAPSALVGKQAANASESEETQSAPSALVSKQAANASAESEETKEWEPDGILVKIGYLRSKVLLHIASSFLPTSMVQRMPAMDAMDLAKVFDVPVVETPFFGLAVNSTAGMLIYTFVLFGLVVTIGYMVKFYTSIVAAQASLKPAAEGDDDSLGNALREISGLALPMLLQSSLSMVNEMTNTIILGQIGTPVELASLGLVQSLYNCGIITVGGGLMQVMDTVVSQAFGAGNKDLCLVYLQRCRFCCFVLLALTFPLFWFSEAILLLCGQEADVAARTRLPSKLFWLAGVFVSQGHASFIFLKNLGDLSTIWVFAVSNIVHVSCALFFGVFLGMGVSGIAIAMACQNFMTNICMANHLCNRSVVKDFTFREKLLFTPACLDGLGDYLTLGVPSCLSSAAESWYWELNTMVIGWFGAVSLAAHSSTQSLTATIMIICASTVGAGTTLIARALGSGHPRKARFIAFASIVLICTSWSVGGTFILFANRPLARVFNSNSEVLTKMHTLLHLSATTGILTCTQLTAASVLRAMLKHRMVATISFFNYYIVAFPLGFYLAVYGKVGVFGVYNGLMVGMTLSSLTLVRACANIDFDAAAVETKARLIKESEKKVPKKV